MVNNVEASVEACDHLIKLGHKDIAFISGPANRVSSDFRTKGFQKAMEGKTGCLRPDH